MYSFLLMVGHFWYGGGECYLYDSVADELKHLIDENTSALHGVERVCWMGVLVAEKCIAEPSPDLQIESLKRDYSNFKQGDYVTTMRGNWYKVVGVLPCREIIWQDEGGVDSSFEKLEQYFLDVAQEVREDV